MNLPSESNKQIAEIVKTAFDGEPKIFSMKHHAEDLEINILETEDSPDVELTSFGTVGLSDTMMLQDGKDFATRVELVTFGQTKDHDTFQDLIAAASFYLMRTNALLHPGFVLPNFVKEFEQNTTVPHLYFSAPAMWENLLDTEFDDKRVNWLWILPISEKEFQFLQENGDYELEVKLEENEADVTDLERGDAV